MPTWPAIAAAAILAAVIGAAVTAVGAPWWIAAPVGTAVALVALGLVSHEDR